METAQRVLAWLFGAIFLTLSVVVTVETLSRKLFNDALNCNAGKDPCTTGKKYSLVSVPVSAADVALVRSAVKDISLPAWSEVCDKANPGCTDKWKATVGPLVGIK